MKNELSRGGRCLVPARPPRRLTLVALLTTLAAIAFTWLVLAAPADAANTWSPAASMGTPRVDADAVDLPGGTVLVAGGRDGAEYQNSAEIYDPATDSWSGAAAMDWPRGGAGAAELPGGKVLVAGGTTGRAMLDDAVIYDPATDSWSDAAPMGTVRAWTAAAPLPGGKVLVAGGFNSTSLASAEIYDPATDSWSPAASMSRRRSDLAAAPLPDGKVLVAGGSGVASAEIYDPATDSWSAAASMGSARQQGDAAELPGGKVLVAGGQSGFTGPVSSAEIYDPAANSWSAAAPMSRIRSGPAAAPLPGGRVLVAGGAGAGTDARDAEIYQAALPPPTAVDDDAEVEEDSPPTTIDVLANDLNPDGGPMLIESVDTAGTYGEVEITNAGADLTYAPAPGYCNDGPDLPGDAFTYTLNGGSTATVSVAVICDADPDTYYVRTVGTGTACTLAHPCATVENALTAHRAGAVPGDVIDVGPGTFAENVDAGDPADRGLTIRGTLAADGSRETTVSGDGGGGSSCSVPCAVQLGAAPDVEVQLRDVDVSNDTADPHVSPVSVEGGSDLTNVVVTLASGSGASEGIALCADPGTKIRDSEVDARGSSAVPITIEGGVWIRNSELHAGDHGTVILQCSGSGPDPTPIKLTRSTLASAPDSGNPVLNLTSDLVLDSSLIIGGSSGATYQGSDAATWEVVNSTIDAGAPGVDNTGDGMDSLELFNVGGAPLEVSVDSSILVEEIHAYDANGTLVCTYADLPAARIPAEWTDDCEIGGGSTNSSTPPEDLFAGGDPYDWRLESGSPAIDSGQPGAIPAGLATQDLAGKPRRVAGRAANCPDPIRDKGAYESAGPPCSTLPPTLKNGADPEVGTQLGSNAGRWTNKPTGYRSQFLRCDAAGDDCDPITDYQSREARYKATPADAGHTLRARYLATNASGDSAPATSAPSGVVTQDLPTNVSPPTIRGGESPVKGSGLNSTPGQWTSPPSTYLLQWLRCDAVGGSCTEITEYRPRQSYTPRGIDLGHTLRVRVIATNGAGDSEPATSEPSGVVSDGS
jgi:N-acetylneuraminic acid mutarotase